MPQGLDHTPCLLHYFAASAHFFYFISDVNGHCTYANDALLTYAGLNGDHGAMVGSFNSSEDYRAALGQSLEKGRAVATLLLRSPQNPGTAVRWEFSLFMDDKGGSMVQAIGLPETHAGSFAGNGNGHAGRVADRYKAYEHSTEGLWKFVSDLPVPVGENPDQVIEEWHKYAYLADCNDNLAKMYGYEKPEDIIGARLRELFDASNIAHIGNLRTFVRNGFRTMQVETQEYDRYGNIKYFLNRMEGVVEQGKLHTVWGTQQDITGQRLAEKGLQKSELFYRSLIAESQDGIVLTDEKGIIHFAVLSVKKVLGYDPEDLLGKPVFLFVHPEDQSTAQVAFSNELNGIHQPPFISIRLLKKDREWLWCMVRGSDMIDNPGVGRMVIYFYDNTEGKKMLGELQNQAALLNNVTDVIVTTDLNRVVTSWNSVIEQLTGIRSTEAVGKPVPQVIEISFHPFATEQVFEIVQQEGIWKGEISFTGFDGETRYLLHTVSLLKDEKGQPTGLMGVGKDITERKRIEAQLQQSEVFYRSLATHSLGGIILTDATGLITYCGPSLYYVSGYSADQVLGRTIFEFVHPEDHPYALETFAMEIKKESVLNYAILRLKHASRGWTWATVRAHNLLHDPVLKGVVVYFTDDSKRKGMEDRLRESESRFRNLIHNLKLGVILQNVNAEMLICNQAAMDLLGLTEDQLLGVSSFDPRWNVIHEDGTNFPGIEHPVPVAIATRKPVRDVVMGVHRPLKNDRVWLLVNAEPVFDDEKNLVNVICSFTDLTEQRRLSQELIEQEIQKQKLITQATIDGQEKERQEIGKELHDNINQHLTTTRLYLEVAREKTSGEVQEMINLAHKNLAEIVHEIRQISQSLVPPTLGDIGLLESVQDLCDSLNRSHPFDIEFQYPHFQEEEFPDNMKLMIFRIIQEQVSNIIRHAHAKTVKIRLNSDAEFVHLLIEDDGQGFDPQHHKKGMGLKNIINRAALFDGRVEIGSSPGQGCFVAVNIPVPANGRV